MSTSAATVPDYPFMNNAEEGSHHRGNISLYTILGVSPFSSQKDIRASYHRLSLVFHTDRLVGQSKEVSDVMSARFIQITEAYDVLSDPIKRAAYDALGKKGVKELSLIPVDIQNSYDPKTIGRLLRVVHEEKALLQTAVRLGSTSDLSIKLNGENFANVGLAATKDFVSAISEWIKNDPEKEWKTPGGGRKTTTTNSNSEKKDVETEKNVLEQQHHQQHSSSTQSENDNDNSSNDVNNAFYGKEEEKEKEKQKQKVVEVDQKEKEKEETPPPEAPKPLEFNIKEARVISVQFDGKQHIAVVPLDAQQQAVKEEALIYSKKMQEHQKTMKEYKKSHHHQHDHSSSSSENNENSQQKIEENEAEEDDEEDISYNRPPLPSLMMFYGSHYFNVFRQHCIQPMLRPYQMSGHYAMQLPMEFTNSIFTFLFLGTQIPKILSLFSVQFHRTTQNAIMKAALDCEVHRPAGFQWLSHFSMTAAAGSAFQIGFKKILSSLYDLKMKLTCWNEAADSGFFPSLKLELNRKLSKHEKLKTSMTFPGISEISNHNNNKFGEMSVRVENDQTGTNYGMKASPGNVTFNIGYEKRFIICPSKIARKGKSAFSFFRKFNSTVERGVEFILSDNPILAWEDTFWFVKPFDGYSSVKTSSSSSKTTHHNHDEAEKHREQKNRERHEKKKQREEFRKKYSQPQQEGGEGNEEKDKNNSEFNNYNDELFITSSDDDDDDYEFFDGDSTSTSFHSHTTKRRKKKFSCFDDDANNKNEETETDFFDDEKQQQQDHGGKSKEREELRTTAEDHLLHGFGVSIGVYSPILFALIPSIMPEGRGNVVALGFHYRRGQHRIQFPIRISFSNNLFIGAACVCAPYVLNWLFTEYVASSEKEEAKQKIVERRIKGDAIVQTCKKKAQMECTELQRTSAKPKVVLEENNIGGCVIVNATYGVLEKKLNYPANIHDAYLDWKKKNYSFGGASSQNEKSAESGNNNNNAAAASNTNENNNNNNNNKTEGADDELVYDCTIAVQSLVHDSRIHIASGAPKHLLPGFCDPQPWLSSENSEISGGEKKKLKVVYRFNHKLHECVVDDEEELKLPMREHLVIERNTAKKSNY